MQGSQGGEVMQLFAAVWPRASEWWLSLTLVAELAYQGSVLVVWMWAICTF